MIKNKLFMPSAFIVAGILGICVLGASFKIAAEKQDRQNRMSQIFGQEKILKEGDKLVERGFYAEALVKYEGALGPKFVSKNEDKRGPIVRKIRLHRITGDFKAGLDEFNNAPASLGLDPELRMELEALQKSTEINTKQPVYEYIDHLRQKYQDSLPPKAYNAFSSIAIGQILRLYDTIGDYDAGIAFIDEILAYFRTGKAGDPKPGKVDAEYMKVREAFLQDKAEGTKGRATQALIQSDYFPW